VNNTIIVGRKNQDVNINDCSETFLMLLREEERRRREGRGWGVFKYGKERERQREEGGKLMEEDEGEKRG